MQQATGDQWPLEGARSTQGQWTSQSAGEVAKQHHHGHQKHASQGSGQYHVEYHSSHGVTKLAPKRVSDGVKFSCSK